jgi:murein DD-endopeptidase MepM/ murein hydrolase activator NlpD
MHLSHKKNTLCVVMLAGIVLVTGFSYGIAHATSESDLTQQISDTNRKIADLEAQISGLSANLNSTSKQAQTLKSALATLELTRKKLETDLSLTTTKIRKTSLTLTELATSISATEKKIGKSSDAVAQGIRNISMAEDQSTVQELLNQHTLSDAWDYVNALRAIHSRVSASLADLKELKSSLDSKESSARQQKASLVTLQKNLSGQKQAVEYSKTQKSDLLTSTQNSAAAYQTQLAAAVTQKALYEKELAEYESKLHILIDPTAIPAPRHGLLAWPLKDVFITQYFGYTAAAAILYKTTGKHGGDDFRAAIGTPVYAALSGVVTDTEAVKYKAGCQYGKFVLIKHPNGLSTIYGHFSSVSVSPGDTVQTGELLGYSGMTGYSTGPHLHFGVYATEGIRIVDSSALGSVNCKGIKTVAADPKAYLDPQGYLPNL